MGRNSGPGESGAITRCTTQIAILCEKNTTLAVRFEALPRPDTSKAQMSSSLIPKSWTFFLMHWLSMKPCAPLRPFCANDAVQRHAADSPDNGRRGALRG